MNGTKGDVIKLKIEDLVEDPSYGLDNDDSPVDRSRLPLPLRFLLD